MFQVLSRVSGMSETTLRQIEKELRRREEMRSSTTNVAEDIEVAEPAKRRKRQSTDERQTKKMYL